jgi:hypothetical protein
MRKVSRMLHGWKLINRREYAEGLEIPTAELKRRSFLPPRLCWVDVGSNQLNTLVSGSVDQAVVWVTGA